MGQIRRRAAIVSLWACVMVGCPAPAVTPDAAVMDAAPGLDAFVSPDAFVLPDALVSPDGSALDASDAGASDRLAIVVDAATRVASTLGPSGGELVLGSGADAITLTVPAGALLESTEIAMTRVTSAAPASIADAVALEPEGLVFFRPATLRIASGADAEWAFGWTADGLEPHLVPRAFDGSDLVLPIFHFSGAGTGTGSPPSFAPTADETAASQAIALQQRAEAASGAPVDLAARAAALSPWIAHVPTRIHAARDATTPATFDVLFARAYAEFESLTATISQIGLDDDPAFSAEFGPVLPDLRDDLRAALVAEVARIRTRAVAAGDFHVESEIDRRVFPIALLLVEDLANDPVLSSTALSRDSNVDVVVEDVRIDVGATPSDLQISARTVATFAGEPLGDALVQVDVSLVHATVAGDATLTRSPTAGGIVLAATASDPDVVVSIRAHFLGFGAASAIEPDASRIVRFENAADVLALRIGDSSGDATAEPGAVLTLDAAAVFGSGQAVDGRLVRFTLDGPGSLTSPTATTDTSGHALVQMTVAGPTGTTRVTASTDLAGATLTASVDVHARATSLSIEPALAILDPSGTVELTATLTGAPEVVAAGVRWGARSGVITGSGTTVTYTAPSVPGRYQVRATASGDATAIALTDVVVLGTGPHLEVVIVEGSDACSGGTFIDHLDVTAIDADGMPVSGALVRFGFDGSFDDRTTNASGRVQFGLAPAPSVEAFVSWIEGGVPIATRSLLAEYQAQIGDPCHPRCGAVCSVHGIPPEIMGNPTVGFRCACNATGCCPSGSSSGYNCYNPSDC